jgi:hypothetical protein
MIKSLSVVILEEQVELNEQEEQTTGLNDLLALTIYRGMNGLPRVREELKELLAGP